MYLGTATNILTVLIGTVIGVTIGSRIPDRIRDTITAALGLLTGALAIREVGATDDFVLVLAAVLVGAVIGELLRIEQGLEHAGRWLQVRLAGGEQGLDVELPEVTEPNPPSKESRFAEGFVIASLVFTIGPLTILGSINDGLGDPELLLVKAGLDGFASIAFASVYGWGVGLAAVSVLVIQGTIALLASSLDGVLTDPMLDALASAGGVLLLGISLRLLDLKKVRVANMLPALVLAPLLVWAFG
jgi:uncharacterized membrane protein YqgA involved in biofilm formation